MRSKHLFVHLALLALMPCSTSFANPLPPARRIEFADLVAIQPTGGELAEIDRAGRLVAVEYRRHILVVERTSGKVLDLGEGTAPKWAPIGGRLAFYSSREGSLQLWAWMAGSQPRRLTDIAGGVNPDPSVRFGGAFSDALTFNWSSDGARIVFYSRVFQSSESDLNLPLVVTSASTPGTVLQGIFTEPDISSGIPQLLDGRAISDRARRQGEKARHRIFVVPYDGGSAIPVGDITDVSFHPTWGPRSSRIIAARLRASVPDDRIVSLTKQDDLVSEIVRYDSGGRSETLVSGPMLKFLPQISPNGQFLAYLTGDGWTVASRKLIVVRAGDGTEVDITAKSGVQSFDWLDSQTLAVRYGAETRELLRFSTLTKKFRPISDPATGYCNVRSVFVRDTKLYLRNRCDARTLEIATLGPDDDDANLLLGRVEVINWTTRSGQRRKGWLLLPPEWEGGPPPPVIVDVYPLAHEPDWMAPLAGNQAWAASGYAVFKPSPRAPHVWRDDPPTKGPLGWDTAEDDVISGIDFLANSGVIDPTKVCLFGHSNGGSIVAELISRNNRFACAVIVAPALANWVRPTLLMPNGRSIFRQFSGGYSIDSSPSDYVALSPVFRIHNARTPTLIAAGDQDGDFLLDSIELFNGMNRPGVDVTLVRYPKQGHVFTGDALDDFWKRQMKFFQEHLK